MSASLVGSEMCIRDRFRSWCAHCVRGRISNTPRASALPGEHTVPEVATVSYTHLTLPTICSV
eukprot:9168014-Alexandrium_andersonii.AAC.1